MKHKGLLTFFMMFVFSNFCPGQNKGSITLNGPTTSVRTIIQDRKGNIWLASNEGIIRYDGKSFTNITGNLYPNRFFTVIEDTNGNFWFGNYGSGVYYYDGKSLQQFTTRDGLINNWIIQIYEDKNGYIWFGANGGASRYDGKSFRNFIMDGDTAIEIKSDNSYQNFTSGSSAAFPIIEDKSGKLWFGFNQNIFIYNGRSFKIFRDNIGNPVKNIWSIIEDKKGNIWLGGDGGLWRYDGNSFSILTRNPVRYIYEDKKGDLWTSAFNDRRIFAFSRYAKKSLFEKNPIITEIKQSLNLFGILEVSDGSIWFGAFDGVYRYDGSKIKDFK